jgi:hypothetical protein
VAASSTPAQRAITEVIESVASTEARVSILIRALGRAGLARVPERGPEVLRFLEGPLLDALVERLGPTIGNEVAEQLRPILRVAAHGSSVAPPARRTSRPPPAEAPQGEARPTIRVVDPARFDSERPTFGPAEPVIPASERLGPDSSGVHPTPRPRWADAIDVSQTATTRRMDLPRDEAIPAASLFILASLDDRLVGAVESLAGVAVRRVRGLFELVDASDEARDRVTTLIFDCASPPVHVASLLALAADMPEPMQVAVLGATKLDLAAIHAAPDRTIGWYYLDRLAPEQLRERVAAAARRHAEDRRPS